MSERQLPFRVAVSKTDPVEVTNPFSGESYKLEADALAVYDTIKGAEYSANYDLVRKGLDWFREYEPEAYMVLLD
tara:strand:- start:95 stop:319 length:225 start_codon:yes stop_codon:yes gene_type:complete